MEEWDKFDRNFVKKVGDKEYVLNMQECLCKKYDITITNYKTPKQRRSIKINKVIDRVFSGIDKGFVGLDKFFHGLDNAFKQIDRVSNSINSKKSDKRFRDMGF